MEKMLFVFFLYCSLSGTTQTKCTFFAKNEMLVNGPENAFIKIEKHELSKKKFELVQFRRYGDQWKPWVKKTVVSVKKNNKFVVKTLVSGSVNGFSRTSKLEIADTTDRGYIIREFVGGKCILEAEVSSVFPMVYHGFCKYLSKDKNVKPKVSYFYKNLRYDEVGQPIIQEANIPTNNVDILPKYPGGMNQFINDLLIKTSFPPDIIKEDTQGIFLMHFTIDSLGKIANPHFQETVNPKIEEAILKGCAQITTPWKPAVYNLRNTHYTYLFPIQLEFEEKPDPDKVLVFADRMPEYPGGKEKLRRDIARNLKYPIEARKEGIEGQVIVRFIVDTEGKMQGIHVVKSVHPYLDFEALRVVEALGRWIPGVHQGKKVRVCYTVPINFVLKRKLKSDGSQ